MELQNLSMLSSSVVFLLRQRLTSIELTRQDLEGLLTPGVSIAQTPDGRLIFTSVADQMEVIVGANRVDVKDLSRQPPRSDQVARIAEGILQALKADASAYGINYEFETQAPTGESGASLLKTFVRPDLGDYVKGLRGAALTLFFDLDDRRVNTAIEPKWKKPEGDKIFVNANVHKDLGDNEQVPGQGQLAKEISAYFERVKGTLSGVPT